jgi:hypothetical protein
MELLERLAANDPQLIQLVSKDVPRSVGMRELATALALNTTLTHLRSAGRGLVAADAHELAGMLERNKTLKTLNLAGNNVGLTALVTWLQPWSVTRRSRSSS